MTAALRRVGLLVAVAAAPGLGACSGDTVRTLAVDAGYGPKKVDAPDFVASSRPKETPEFMAVGVDAPKRPVKAKTAQDQKALEAELENARGRNVARGRAAESAAKGVAKDIGKDLGKGIAPPADPATPPPQ